MIEWAELAIGEHRLRCPFCGRDRRGDQTLGVTMRSDHDGVAHCHRCHYVETFSGSDEREQCRRAGRLPPPKTQRLERLSDWWRWFWNTTRELHDDDSPAARYLRARGLPIPRCADLRWLDSHKHPCGYCGPCLIGLVRDVLSGEALTLHRTWLTSDGMKAPIERPRLLLPRHRKSGGVIELAHASHFTGCVGVAEGVETALALAHSVDFVWSSVDAGNLKALPVVPGVSQLVIAADGDETGRRAAEACAARYHAAGIDVRVWRAPNGCDLADLAAEPEETP